MSFNLSFKGSINSAMYLSLERFVSFSFFAISVYISRLVYFSDRSSSSVLMAYSPMLEQIGKHSGCDLRIKVKGDLEVDEHHTIEDTAITLGEAFYKCLTDKRGIERYGFCLPMDDNLCSVAIDFGGRSWLVFDATFKREYIGDLPTEMIYHFFKSFSDASRMRWPRGKNIWYSCFGEVMPSRKELLSRRKNIWY